MFKIIAIVLTALSIQSAFAMQSEQEKLNSLYDEIWHYTMITSPTYATYVGYPGQNGRWPDPSLKAAREDEDCPLSTSDAADALRRVKRGARPNP